MIPYHEAEHGTIDELVKEGYKRISGRYKIVSKIIASAEEQLSYLQSLNYRIENVDQLERFQDLLYRTDDRSLTHWIWDIPYLDFRRFPLSQ